MLRRLLIAEAPGRATHDAQLPVRPVLTTQPAARCVLQVPGFESLAANGLRELCTNYVAERLHHLFVEHVVGQVEGGWGIFLSISCDCLLSLGLAMQVGARTHPHHRSRTAAHTRSHSRASLLLHNIICA